VRDLIANLDGCSGGKAGEIVAAAGVDRMLCKDVTRRQAESLLQAARASARPVGTKRIGAVGPEAFFDHAYACALNLRHHEDRTPTHAYEPTRTRSRDGRVRYELATGMM
jgi:hypothetical protein